MILLYVPCVFGLTAVTPGGPAAPIAPVAPIFADRTRGCHGGAAAGSPPASSFSNAPKNACSFWSRKGAPPAPVCPSTLGRLRLRRGRVSRRRWWLADRFSPQGAPDRQAASPLRARCLLWLFFLCAGSRVRTMPCR